MLVLLLMEQLFQVLHIRRVTECGQSHSIALAALLRLHVLRPLMQQQKKL